MACSCWTWCLKLLRSPYVLAIAAPSLIRSAGQLPGLPYIESLFSFHERVASVWPWWPNASKHLLIPIEPTVHDSPLDVTSLAHLLDLAWSLEGKDRARKGSLLLAPALAIEEEDWPWISYAWASPSTLPWDEGVKSWIESNLVRPSLPPWFEDEDIAPWPWDQICWAPHASSMPKERRFCRNSSILAAGFWSVSLKRFI